MTRLDEKLDDLAAEITCGTTDDGAAMAAFHDAISKALKLPTFALVVGEQVQLDGVEYASIRRGIVARIRDRLPGSRQVGRTGPALARRSP